MKVEHIAAIAHECNRIYCISIGDDTQKHWEDSPEWQKQSAIDGVLAIREGRVLRAEDSHNNWLKQKEAEGWTYGPVKDPDKKQHPCMIAFDKLAPAQWKKDHIFYGVVRLLLFVDGMLTAAS